MPSRFRRNAVKFFPLVLAATIGLATFTLFIGLNPQPLLAYAQAAARAMGG